jgi:hypothetical protein
MKKYVLTADGIWDRENDFLILYHGGDPREFNRYNEWVQAGNVPVPIRPSPLHILDGDEWVVDLEKMRNQKLQEIAKARYEEEVGGFEFNGEIFHSDRESRSTIFQTWVRHKDDQNFQQYWKTKSGWALVDSVVLGDLLDAYEQNLAMLFAKEKDLTEQLDSATTEAEIEAITWTGA